MNGTMIRRISSSSCNIIQLRWGRNVLAVMGEGRLIDYHHQQKRQCAVRNSSVCQQHSYDSDTSSLSIPSFCSSPRGLMLLHRFPSLDQYQAQRYKYLIRMFSSANSFIEDDDDDDDDDNDDEPPIPPGTSTRYAVVDHDRVYQKMMDGLHGQQLASAQLEGEGKDEPDFDPFLEEELEEARLIYEEEKRQKQQKENKSVPSSTDNDNKATAETSDIVVPNVDDIAATIEDTPITTDEKDSSSIQNQYKLFRQKYNNDGSLKRSKSELAILRAGAPAGGRIAVVALGGTQYKVTTDDVLIVNLLQPTHHYAVGTIHTLSNEHILLVSSSAMTLVGMPYVQDAEVDILVEEITKDEKVIVYKKRRRKNYQRKNGFRRCVTMLRILDIRFPEVYDHHNHTIRADPELLIPTNGFKIK